MRSKWYRWQCMLMAVIVLCTGLYIETAKAVSVFERASVANPDAAIYVADNTYDDARLCIVETLGSRNAVTKQVLVNGINYSKRVARISFDFLCSMCVLLQKEDLSAYLEKVELKIPCHLETISNYIHKSDGEK